MAKAKTTKDEEKDTRTDGYEVPQGEANHAHLEIEMRKFNPITGERLSKPKIQKFNVEQFKRFYDPANRGGYYINKVLYLPKGLKASDYPADK